MVDVQGMKKEILLGMSEYLEGISPDDPNPKFNTAKGKAFTEFYIRDIASQTDGITDPYAVDEGFDCDGSDDEGIDFIYPKDNGEFWIFQSKYKGGNSSLTKDEVVGFFDIHKRVFGARGREDANDVVRGLLSDFDDKKSAAIFILLTNAKASDGIKQLFARLESEERAKPGNENYTWLLMDLPKIQSKYEDSLIDSEDKPNVVLPINSFGGKPGLIDFSEEIQKSTGKKYKTIVTVVNGLTLLRLCKRRHWMSLFDSNIRGFLGAGKGENSRITDTLSEKPAFFYLYNNGMSAICEKLDVQPSGLEVHCEGFQIINGAQTASSIREFGAPQSDVVKKKLEDTWVLLRVTEFVNEGADDFKRDIVKANNTQNVIKDADFHANDEVQQSLRTQINKQGFQFGGKELVYMPKRAEKPRGKLVFFMEDMAKALFAFKEDQPHELNSMSTKQLFDEKERDSKPPAYYWALFGKNGQKARSVNPEEAREFAAIALLSQFVKLKVSANAKNHERDSIPGMIYRCRGHFLWSYGHVYRKICSPRGQKAFRDGILGGSAFKDDGFASSWFTLFADRCIGRTLERDNDSHVSEEGDGGDDKTLNFKLWLRDKGKTKTLIKEIGYLKNDHHFDAFAAK